MFRRAVPLVLFLGFLAGALPSILLHRAGSAFAAPVRSELAGTWEHRNAEQGFRFTITFRKDGTGTLGDVEVEYSVEGDRLLIVEEGETVPYQFELDGDDLVISGGDLEGPTRFVRTGGKPSHGIGAKSDAAGAAPNASGESDSPAETTPPVGGGATSDARIVGKWQSENGGLFELRPDGSGANRRGTFRYVASDGFLLYDDGAAMMLLTYRIEGDQLHLTSHGETAVFSKAKAGASIGSATGAKESGAAAGAASGERKVIVNKTRLATDEIRKLEAQFQVRILDGAYWYDGATGAWGLEGGPTMGFLPPRLRCGGPLRADASGGGTGVFVNGRELHPMDVAALQKITVVQPGRYWVDERGNCGYEGNPTPILNLVQLSNQAKAASGGSYHSRNDITGIGSGGDGKTSYVMGKDWSVIIGD